MKAGMGVFSRNAAALATICAKKGVYHRDKKVMAMVLAIMLVVLPVTAAQAGSSTGVYASSARVPSAPQASPTASTISINGEIIAFEAYNIGGANYFKLRDLAYSLNGTARQFEVGYNDATKEIALASGKPYVPVGGEMAKGSGEGKTANPTPSRIYFDGKQLILTVFNIGGNNYFKLRDLMEALDVFVGYDEGTKAVSLDTGRGYEQAPAIYIDGRVVESIQGYYPMTIGGALYESATAICISRVYELIQDNCLEEIPAPDYYGRSYGSDLGYTQILYSLDLEVSFMAAAGIDGPAIRQYHFYSCLDAGKDLGVELEGTDYGSQLIHDFTRDTWYKVLSGDLLADYEEAHLAGLWYLLLNDAA